MTFVFRLSFHRSKVAAILMPSTPETPTGARDVSAASDECRMNAIKNRKENDWFGHDAGSRTPSSSSGQRPTSASGGAARTSGRTSRESEQWFRYDASKGCSPSSSSKGGGGKQETEAKAREMFVAQQDWYKHGPEVPDPPSLEKGSKTRSRRSACSEVRRQQKAATDSNDWFRHDHKTASGSGSRKVNVKVASPTALWAQNGAGSPLESTSGPRSKSRLTAPEADRYYRRDKIGSSAEWFSHEHPRHDDDVIAAASGGSGGKRTRGTPEGGRIADRLKGESEDWFSHDGNRPYVTPTPVVKGNSPMTREMMERAQGREIKQIFRMDENLRTTWTAPPALFGPPGSPGAAPGAATTPSAGMTTPSGCYDPSSATASSANCDVIQDKMDGLVIENGRKPGNSE